MAILNDSRGKCYTAPHGIVLAASFTLCLFCHLPICASERHLCAHSRWHHPHCRRYTFAPPSLLHPSSRLCSGAPGESRCRPHYLYCNALGWKEGPLSCIC